VAWVPTQGGKGLEIGWATAAEMALEAGLTARMRTVLGWAVVERLAGAAGPLHSGEGGEMAARNRTALGWVAGAQTVAGMGD
jgi:hypothetical protein